MTRCWAKTCSMGAPWTTGSTLSFGENRCCQGGDGDDDDDDDEDDDDDDDDEDDAGGGGGGDDVSDVRDVHDDTYSNESDIDDAGVVFVVDDDG